jgi:hypothetical protein
LDVDRLIEEIYDPSTPPSMSRRYYLNQLTASEDAWIAPHEWDACSAPGMSLADGELITIGFDGAVRDDSTALVACRVDDGHLELLGCWERPTVAPVDWEVDREAVHATVAATFDRYTVVGFFADPPHWQDAIDQWTHEFGESLRVRSTQGRPIEWWTGRTKAMVDSLARFHDAVIQKRLTHHGNNVLTRHIVNARRRETRSGLTISKDHPGSSRKIDAAIAAVLAYEARAGAVSIGVSPEKPKSRRLYRF